MLDFNHVVNAPGFNIQTFFGTTKQDLEDWQTWIKPRGSRMLWFVALGGGGAGGNSDNSTSSGGAGGGGSGGQASVLLPSTMVPDTMYIQAGRGGIPNASISGTGGNGLNSYVSLEPNPTLLDNNILLRANGGSGGVGTNGTGGGIGGSGAAAVTVNDMIAGGRGIYQLFGGQSGSAGGSNGNPGVDLALPTNGIMTSGGAGGGGVGAAGGSILSPTGSSTLIDIPGGSSGSIGKAGVILDNFIMHYGGSGGGGSATAGAQDGGRAAYGGGGGGAGGNTSFGGKGGDGIVLVLSW